LSRIDWLLCKTDPADKPAGLSAEVAAEERLDVEAAPLLRPLTFLSPAERKTLAALRFPKRRREWLLGRWTAKHLLRQARPAYAALPLNAISVGNDPDGAPYLSVAGEGRLPLSLSISHRADRAFCALWSPPPSLPGAAVGADIERVEPRDPAFVRDFFTAGEAERVWRCPDDRRDTLVTAIWSAKEAVLKVLRLGLTVDTRRVEIRHLAGLDAPHALSSPNRWIEVEVHCTLPDTPSLCAWWRSDGEYVLTLAAYADPGDPPYPT
jgi:4'-phosphopantetheinyl transferase